MNLKILIDVSLSPQWVGVFKQHDVHAVHWSNIGSLKATDSAIMEWARKNDHVVFTHDLDFGTLLAMTQAEGPSVLQVRTQDVLPGHLENMVMESLRHFESLLKTGALVVIDERHARVRILPLTSH